MNVTSKIKLDMTQQNNGVCIYAVQGDGNTRCVEITLMSGGRIWNPPSDVEAAIAYRQPGGTKGLYNRLDDGSNAITISGNTARVILAAQMLSVPGPVQAAIVFNNKRLDQLTSFPFVLSVEKNQFAGAQQSEDYIRLQWLEEQIEQLISTEQAVRAGVAAQEAETAAEAANTAAAAANTAAAAAQAVVDGIVPEVNQIEADLQEVENLSADGLVRVYRSASEFQNGTIYHDTEYADDLRKRSKQKITFPAETTVFVQDGFRAFFVYYNEDGTFLSSTSWISGRGKISGNIPFRVVIEKNPRSAFTVEEGKNIYLVVTAEVRSSQIDALAAEQEERKSADNALRDEISAITPDDDTIDGKPLTSKKIMDTLCQPFSESGNPVQVFPVENYPLGVEVRIEPKQEGSEDPSPENVRPIVGLDAVHIVHSNVDGIENTFNIVLPETVYGGTLALDSGVLTVKYGNIAVYAGESIPGRWISDRDIFADGAVPTTGAQVVYELAQPYAIQLTPRQVIAIAGMNTISTDADGVIVTGREDPNHTITQLKNAILSLGGSI